MNVLRNLCLALVSTLLLGPGAALAETAPPSKPGAQQAPTPGSLQQDDRPTIEVAFVLDTTSSMTGLIEGAKAKIWSIASRIAQGHPTPHLKVGLVAYRDIGDEYVTRRYDLTTDLDAVFLNLKKLRAEGGGDIPEHVGRGLGEAVSKLSWDTRSTTMKMIFLVGDAPPHYDYQDEWNARTWAKAAIKKGIVVNTVRCGTAHDTEVAWRELARLGDGTYTSIEQSGGMVAVRTPYDEKIAKLNAEIATRTVYAGEATARREAKTRAAEVAAMPASAAADRLDYMANASHGAGGAVMAAPKAVAGSRDLAAEPAALATVKDEELPEDLRGLSKEERQKKVEKVATERKALEAEVDKASHEREAWLSKNAPAKADSFDAQVMGEVKKRAARYNIAY